MTSANATVMGSLVSTAWLADNIDGPDLRIVECTVAFTRADGVITAQSGLSDWEGGHIPNSAFVDLLTTLADRSSHHRYMMPPRAQLINAMESLGVGEGTRVVLYDRDKNMWAARVWWMLRDFGFDAAILDGGWQAWKAEQRPTSTDPAPTRPRATFIDRGPKGLIVGKETVMGALDDDSVTLVNALPAEQHDGTTNDYGRRGHIPGALNVPAGGLVNPDTHVYLLPDQLALKTEHVHGKGGDRVITYCGGGISAASTAFVLAQQGVDDVVIYDASMSEWAADESLPLEY